MNLRPQRSFTVVRQIENHLDTDTNYVQAVIRNAYTDAIIATLQLTDKGSQRFSKNWQVPADASGLGFFISIVTSVYTDSGYTTKNPNYGDQENTYLVKDDTLSNRGGGNGIDVATLRRVVKEELAKVQSESVEPMDIPEMPPMRFDEVLQAINELPGKIEIPEQEKVELAPVLSAIADVKQTIVDKEVTEPTELQPVLDALSEMKSDDDVDQQEVMDTLSSIVPTLMQELPPKMEEIMHNVELSIAPTSATAGPKPVEAPAEPVLDMEKLTQ